MGRRTDVEEVAITGPLVGVCEGLACQRLHPLLYSDHAIKFWLDRRNRRHRYQLKKTRLLYQI